MYLFSLQTYETNKILCSVIKSLQHCIAALATRSGSCEKASQQIPYLWGHPVLPVGCLCLKHTLGPGSDVPGAVISITLEDQLTGAFLTGKEGTEQHAISYTVQDLKPGEKWSEARCFRGSHCTLHGSRSLKHTGLTGALELAPQCSWLVMQK